MKKLLVVVVVLLLVVSGCQSRTPQEEVSRNELTMDHLEPSADQVEELEDSQELESEDPENAHEITDKEQISEATSIAVALLDRGEICDMIYSGDLPLLEGEPPQQLGEDEYQLVVSDLHTVEDVETYWKDTFAHTGVAEEKYNELIDSRLYTNINGSLHVKTQEQERPLLTKGEWEQDTLRVLEFTDDRIAVSMETQLVGQPHGEHTLEIEKNANGTWVLTESYFLDA